MQHVRLLIDHLNSVLYQLKLRKEGQLGHAIMFAALLSVWEGRPCLLIGGAPFVDRCLAETDSFCYLGWGAGVVIKWLLPHVYPFSLLFLFPAVVKAELGHDWSWKWFVFIHTQI